MQSPQPHPDRRVPLKPRAGQLLVVNTNSEIASDDLLRGTRELLIRHGGEVYRLRHTRNDKLILTK